MLKNHRAPIRRMLRLGEDAPIPLDVEALVQRAEMLIAGTSRTREFRYESLAVLLASAGFSAEKFGADAPPVPEQLAKKKGP